MHSTLRDLTPLLEQVLAAEGGGSAAEAAITDPCRERAAGMVARAETALEAQDYAAALEELRGVRSALAAAAAPDLELRAILAESWARMMLGELDTSVALLERADGITGSDRFTDLDRAEVLYRLGCCRTKLAENADAIELFTVALDLCDRSGLPCDHLRTSVLEWRSRVYRNQRDLAAAWADAERALQLAQSLGDAETLAHVELQASLVAERTGQWHLARFYAEQAREHYADAGDLVSVGRVLNNLGGLSFLLGRHEEAIAHLKDAFRSALEHGSDLDAAYAVSSLAQVNLRTGDAVSAEEQSRHALQLLGERIDFIEEIGNAQLVLGRALLEQERFPEAAGVFAKAEETFDAFGSISHRAATWVAQGDLARRGGELELAADLYRQAAEALQDFHF